MGYLLASYFGHNFRLVSALNIYDWIGMAMMIIGIGLLSISLTILVWKIIVNV
jgi:hypothetical protein